MMKFLQRTATLLLASGAVVPILAQAQCLECAQQMMQATLTSNAWYNINQSQIDNTRSRDARNSICYQANRDLQGCGGRITASESERFDGKLPDWTAGEAKKVVMNTLKTEYAQRQRSQGRGPAAQWLNTAAGDIARQMAVLTPEFFRRWDAGDRNSADQWYLGQVRQIAERHASGHQGPGMGEAQIGKVPAAARQRAEDASFAVLEPEIQRIERTQGQARATAWAREMGAAVGAGVRNLAPEYLQRAQAEGRAGADRWYAEQAASLARLQIADR